ncbi:MAG: hypothetical protein ACM3ON_10235 [Chloroflexota bacterium]
MGKSLLALALVVLVAGGCAPSKTWTSRPAVQAADTDVFRAELEPLRGDGAFYDSFRLAVRNKTERTIDLDWNETRYIHDGRELGVFGFKGVPARDQMKELKKRPPESIGPEGTLTKVICPWKATAYSPVTHDDVRPGESGFSCGILPKGENGISLVIRVDGKEVRQRVTVSIIEE